MARTSKSRGASTFKLRSGNGPLSFKTMGSSPLHTEDEVITGKTYPTVNVSASKEEKEEKVTNRIMKNNPEYEGQTTWTKTKGSKSHVYVRNPDWQEGKYKTQKGRYKWISTTNPKVGFTTTTM